MLQLKLTIHGMVQDLGYRSSILDFIDQRNLMVKGIITPHPNGTLEIIAQGGIECLKELRTFACTGNNKTKIRDVEEVISEINEYSFDDFSISYEVD